MGLSASAGRRPLCATSRPRALGHRSLGGIRCHARQPVPSARCEQLIQRASEVCLAFADARSALPGIYFRLVLVAGWPPCYPISRTAEATSRSEERRVGE